VLTSFVVSIVRTCTRFAPLTIVLALILAVGAGFYTARNFKINTDINTLISPDLDWRQRDQAFEQAFDQDRMILAVVEAPSPEFASTAAAANSLKRTACCFFPGRKSRRSPASSNRPLP
jgi:predicted RND superfamily exporter protein